MSGRIKLKHRIRIRWKCRIRIRIEVKQYTDSHQRDAVPQHCLPGPKIVKLFLSSSSCRKLRASQQIASVISQSQNRVYLNSASLLLNVAEKSFDEGIMAVAKPTGK